MLQDQSARFINAPGKLPMMGNYFVYYYMDEIADEAALEGRNKNSNSQRTNPPELDLAEGNTPLINSHFINIPAIGLGGKKRRQCVLGGL
jgi:hypothetical protein